MLDGKYRIERPVGQGGFGITYKAVDELLAILVAIKEYFPAELAARDAQVSIRPASERDRPLFDRLKTGFLNEARLLSQFDHPAIVRVLNVFEAHGSAYMVMRFEDGPNLKAWLAGLDRQPTQAEMDRLCAPLLDALELIHGTGFLHRDIAPDNIILRPNGDPVLLDFGAARPVMTEFSAAVTGIVKRGFSPPEQYATNNRSQGPWTDMYALAGTLYQCVTGGPPPESTSRMLVDDMDTARGSSGTDRYRGAFLEAIDWALRLQPKERPQTIADWRAGLLDVPMLQGLPAPVPQQAPPAAVTTAETGNRVRNVEALRERRIEAAPPAADPGPATSRGRGYGRIAAVAGVVLVGATTLLMATFRGGEPPVATRPAAPIEPSAPRATPASPSVEPARTATPVLPAALQTARPGPRIDLAAGSFRDCETCPEMVVVPAGDFLMGSPDSEVGRLANEGPQRRITLAAPFAIAKFETTRGAWRQFVVATSRTADKDCRALQFKTDQIEAYETGQAKADWGATGAYDWENTNYTQDDRHPVACISHADAQAYVGWLATSTAASYRLPSEAEWEYAARGGTSTTFPRGPTLAPTEARYHYPSSYAGSPTARWVRGTASVGSFAANPFGLHDMQGNVWEWVGECAGVALADLGADGRPAVTECSSGVMKGGAFWTSPEWARPAYRFSYGRQLRGAAAGFRVARDVGVADLAALAPLLQRLPTPASKP